VATLPKTSSARLPVSRPVTFAGLRNPTGWDRLDNKTPYRQTTVEVIPLGLIPGIQYLPNAVPLRHGDLLILQTDGISESTNGAGEELGYEGLMRLATNLPVQTVDSLTRSVKFCSLR
jgi:serine phosphatase RsbU (regulator of sigma subunit)